jgi:hypothetical protein
VDQTPINMHLALSLPKALMLLTISGTQDQLRDASGLRYGLIGAALVELAWQGRLRSDGASVTLVETRPTGDALLDSILREVAQQPVASGLRAWILHLGRALYDIDKRILDSLEDDGVLRRECTKLLGVITSTRYPLLAPGLQRELRAQLRQMVRFVSEPEESLVTLIGLLCACELQGAVLSPQEIRQAHDRLRRLGPRDRTSRLIVATVDHLIRESEALAYIVGIG